MVIKRVMIKEFLILNCTGMEDKIGLKVDNNFYIHNFNNKVKNNDQLVISILNLIKKHKANFNNNFSVLVNNGPGSFSSLRVSLAVAKGIKLSKNVNLFGFKNFDLGQFNLINIELLIKKNLLQKNLIKPLYLS
jgi:tRNA A37 threonylcarbamoyladenosine modification protein TsaB